MRTPIEEATTYTHMAVHRKGPPPSGVAVPFADDEEQHVPALRVLGGTLHVIFPDMGAPAAWGPGRERMARTKPPFDAYFLEHLFSAGTDEFLKAVEETPGCEQFVAECNYIQHALRCDTAQTAKLTGRFIERVFSAGPDLTRKKCAGILPALVASKHLPAKTRLSLITTALERGADPDQVLDGEFDRSSARMLATRRADEKVLALFVASRPGPVAATLDEAVDADDAQAVATLLKTHVPTSADTELLKAAITNQKAVAHALIDAGVGLRGPVGKGSALHAAASKGDSSLVHKLLAAGLDPDEVDTTDRDLTPLQYAFMFGEHHPEVLALLLPKSRVREADVTGPQWDWLWFSFGKNAVTALFERFGATLTAKATKLSVLHLAAASGAAPLVQALLEAGADPTVKTSKAQRLAGHSVAKGATPQKVATLLDKRAVLEVFAQAR